MLDSTFARWGRWLLSRPTQFLTLAFLLATANTYASTMAASLFLARAGADALPVYYLFFAALSIPLSLLFSAVIDRWPRSCTLKGMLLIFATVSAVLALSAERGEVGLYALYLGIGICELLLYSVFYVLFSDYFTATETKRLTGPIAVYMAGGGLAGGLLVGAASAAFDARWALLATPLLVGAALVHLVWLTGRERPLDETESAADESLLDSLRLLPRMARRYPITILLGAAVFFNVLLQCFSEYLAFSIYAQHHPDEDDLATFLGLVNAGLNVLGVAIVLLFTNPLLTRIGVARFNLVFPALNLTAFAALIFDQRLAAAIFAHVAYDPFEYSVNVPVQTMNYNAMPHRLVGRVRVVNDGIVYPVALAAAGVVLLVLTDLLTLSQLAVSGFVLCLGFVAVHWALGRQYLRGLVEMLRSGAVDLDQVGDGFKLPDDYVADLKAMLASDDPETVVLGLEMAARTDVGLSMPEVEQVLPAVPMATARLVLGRFSSAGAADVERLLRRLLRSDSGRLRGLALEAMTVRGFALDRDRLGACLADPDRTVRAVAAAALICETPDDREAGAAFRLISEEADLIAACRVLRAHGGPGLVDLLEDLLKSPLAAVRAEALETVGILSQPSDPRVLGWARRLRSDDDPRVRAAAFAWLARLGGEAELIEVAAHGLRDPLPEVRQAATQALGGRGEVAVPALQWALASEAPEACDAAIVAMGKIGGRLADDVLFAFVDLAALRNVPLHRILRRRLPADRPGWKTIAVALDNADRRAIHLVLECLATLGYRRALNGVRNMLAAGSARMRSNAVETLASLTHRRYVLPLLPLLEGHGSDAGTAPVDDAGRRALLGEILESTDRWLRAAATVAWHAETGAVPRRPRPDHDPVVIETVAGLDRRPADAFHYDEEVLMNRLMFLKSVPLFSEMTLDNLLVIDRAMERDTYLADEAVVREGEIGDKLYIVFRGTVSVRRGPSDGGDGARELARLGSGQVFGEMSLFDAETRSATVTAVEETEVLVLDRDRFYSLVQQRPQVLMEMCKVLVGRLRSAIG